MPYEFGAIGTPPTPPVTSSAELRLCLMGRQRRDQGKMEVLQTGAAVERFNELRESVPVGGLFHSTR
jgi:hypothetical protein